MTARDHPSGPALTLAQAYRPGNSRIGNLVGGNGAACGLAGGPLSAVVAKHAIQLRSAVAAAASGRCLRTGVSFVSLNYEEQE